MGKLARELRLAPERAARNAARQDRSRELADHFFRVRPIPLTAHADG